MLDCLLRNLLWGKVQSQIFHAQRVTHEAKVVGYSGSIGRRETADVSHHSYRSLQGHLGLELLLRAVPCTVGMFIRCSKRESISSKNSTVDGEHEDPTGPCA